MLNMFRTKRGYLARDRGARHGRARDMQTAGEDDPAASAGMIMRSAPSAVSDSMINRRERKSKQKTSDLPI